MATCRTCGKTIEFKRTGRGKLMPVDADGTPHFASCGKSPKPLPAVCPHCRSENLEAMPDDNKVHPGKLMCMDCGRWIKWLTAADFQKITGEGTIEDISKKKVPPLMPEFPTDSKHGAYMLASGMWHCSCGCGKTLTRDEFNPGV